MKVDVVVEEDGRGHSGKGGGGKRRKMGREGKWRGGGVKSGGGGGMVALRNLSSVAAYLYAYQSASPVSFHPADHGTV